MTTTIQEFELSVNLLRALLWEYQEALNLQALLNQKSEWYTEQQTNFWTNWYRDVFDLRTANDFGLAVWAIILGQSLYVRFTETGRPTWGFDVYHRNFNRGNFAYSEGITTKVSTETARVLLRLRYWQLVGSGCVPEINRVLADVFAAYAPDAVPAYVVDNHDMTITYHFNFSLPAELLSALYFFDVLPRPAGVSLNIV